MRAKALPTSSSERPPSRATTITSGAKTRSRDEGVRDRERLGNAPGAQAVHHRSHVLSRFGRGLQRVLDRVEAVVAGLDRPSCRSASGGCCRYQRVTASSSRSTPSTSSTSTSRSRRRPARRSPPGARRRRSRRGRSGRRAPRRRARRRAPSPAARRTSGRARPRPSLATSVASSSRRRRCSATRWPKRSTSATGK